MGRDNPFLERAGAGFGDRLPAATAAQTRRVFGGEYLGIHCNISERRFAMPNSSIKNEKMYEDLRKEGNSKEKAARISNAAAARGKKSVGRKGGKAGSYDDWSVADLKKRAKELGVTGYSKLTKDKLVTKLRNH
jgi:hypothetical protein